ncbi:MAG: preprotein translocase subunit SecE [Alphaproteobacteria bacterium]
MADDVTRDVTKGEADAEPARRTNPIQFFREVRRETSKVTWPTWKETRLTTIMVFIMVFLTMIFFFVVDTALGYGAKLLLSLGG